MKDTTFAAPDLHEDFIGLDYPSYGNATTSAVEKINIAPMQWLVNINILALDLGTQTGYAIRERGGRVTHGTESFTPRTSWTPGQRWQRFRSWLAETVVAYQIHALAYEQVVQGQGRSSVAAGDVYGGFKALVELAADSHRLNLLPVRVATVKKSWTGWGDAVKEAMIAEARRRGYRPDSDNAADALAILDWALMQESDGIIRLGDGSMPDPATVLRRTRAARKAKPGALI